MVVERREAQRARSRRFAQADRSVARATPEAWADGNIRPRGVAHDPGASRRSTRNASGFRDRGVGKTRTQTKRAARTEEHVRRLRIILRQGGGSVRSMRAASLLPRGERDRMRGFGSLRKAPASEPPHPDPLPSGEREESNACESFSGSVAAHSALRRRA
jgi:hypothetical protein